MPYARPTLPQLAEEAEADLAARLGAADRPRRNVLIVLARVWAGLAHGLYGFISYLARQMMPYTATEEFLERHAAWWGIRRKPEARSRGRAIFEGNPGGRVESGALLIDEDGRKFQVIESGQIPAEVATSDGQGGDPQSPPTMGPGTMSLEVRAVEGGLEGDLPAGSRLNLISPQSGVKSEARVDEDGLTGGAAAENDARLKERFLTRVQEPPQGGNANDYVKWALEVPGVTRAWPYGNMLGPGTVGLTFVADEAESPIPGLPLVAEVQAYLDDPSRKPVTADVIVFAPLPKPVTPVILMLDPDTVKVRAAVKAELAALFLRSAAPGRQILITHIREAISVAAGEWDHVLYWPVANLQAGPTELLILEDVLFVDQGQGPGPTIGGL